MGTTVGESFYELQVWKTFLKQDQKTKSKLCEKIMEFITSELKICIHWSML